MGQLKIDLDALKKRKEENFKDRLDFIRWYANWQKSVPNKIWSKAQKKLFAKK